MVVTVAVLATLLKDPLTKAFGWTIGEALKGTHNKNIEKSLKTLSTRITEVVKVKTIYKGDDSIDLHEFYVATKIDKIQGTIELVENISNKSMVLEGTVGQGKSIFMRYLTYQEAIKGQRIPIFFELRRLEDNQSLKTAISDKIKNWIPLFNDDDFEKVASSGSLVLFLDGFDEVPYEKVGRLINEIEGWSERYEGLQIIISSRPEADIQKSNSFRVFKLSGYGSYEQGKLVDKLVIEEESRSLLKKAIEDSTTEIQNLLTTPLMVTLFIMNYRSNLEIPTNQSEFYKELFSVLISRHDKTKPGYKRPLNSGISETDLQKVFEHFCFITNNDNKILLTYAESINVIETCLEKQNIKANSIDVLEDFSKVVCLLLKDGLEYSFIHKSIQEYFYSSFILRKSEKAKEKFYTKCIENHTIYSQVRNIINFLKRNDTYNYNKYYKKIILSDYINCYQIIYNSNLILDNLYVRISDEDKSTTVILNNMGRFNSSIMHHPECLNKLFLHIDGLIKSIYVGEIRSVGFSLANTSGIGYEEFQDIKEVINEGYVESIRKITIEVGDNILTEYSEIEAYIAQSDEIDLDL